MRPVILYRDFDFSAKEFQAAQKHFTLTNTRTSVGTDDLVIGRYSVLPFYREQERDIAALGGKLINSYPEHMYVADVRSWYPDLYAQTDFGARLTPRSWFTAEEMMRDSTYDGPYVVKGATNSRKDLWWSHMWAGSKAQAMEVAVRLTQDALIGQQQIIFREYVPLRQHATTILGAPVGYEWRFFMAYGQILCGAWYWSSFYDKDAPSLSPERVPAAFLGEVAHRIGSKVNFCTIDVAETRDGEFVVIELNDGQMAGLSENDPDAFYARLRVAVDMMNR